jgi:hypothetical protein
MSPAVRLWDGQKTVIIPLTTSSSVVDRVKYLHTTFVRIPAQMESPQASRHIHNRDDCPRDRYFLIRLIERLEAERDDGPKVNWTEICPSSLPLAVLKIVKNYC